MRILPSDSEAEFQQELASIGHVAAQLAECAGKPMAHIVELPEEGGSQLAREQLLTDAYTELRAAFILATQAISSPHWLTPPTGKIIRPPGASRGYDYAYDRQHRAILLEERLRTSRADTALSRVYGNFLTNTGMGAISATLLALGLRRGGQLAAHASYFETLTLLRLSPYARTWHRDLHTDSLAADIRKGLLSTLFVETVRYDWELGIPDWEIILDSIDRSPDPPILIVDHTLSGECVAWTRLRDRLLRSSSPLVITVRSGLKLDQEGLEMANLGVVEIWGTSEQETARVIRDIAASAVVTGCSLPWEQAARLMPSFILCPSSTMRYSERVLHTNQRLFQALTLRGALFSRKVYPEGLWHAPFVLLKLREGTRSNYMRLAQVIHTESERRGLGLKMSGSFGFRSDRFETILPDEQGRTGEEPEGTLKVAAGCFAGERFRKLVDLLNEFAEFDSLQDLMRAV